MFIVFELPYSRGATWFGSGCSDYIPYNYVAVIWFSIDFSSSASTKLIWNPIKGQKAINLVLFVSILSCKLTTNVP